MATLKETAKEYIPKQTKNISDLPEVSVDCEIYHDGTGTDKEGREFTYSYLLLNKEAYRVPSSVIKQLKDMLEEMPNLKKFKVKKSGEGLKTEYTFIPLI